MTEKNVILRGRFVRNDLFSIKVLSVHKGVINLLDRDTNHLISLIEDKKNMTGLSLLVPELFIGSLDISSLIDTETVVKTSFKHISTPEQITINNITLNYKNAEIWDDTPILQENIQSNRKNELAILKKSLTAGDSFFSLLTEKDITPYQIKAQKILKEDIKIINGKIHGLKKLIGLGQGLTPSGDDFITGMLLGEKCSENPIPIDKKNITEYLKKTTYAGRTLLYLALKGSFPAYLLTYLEDVTQAAGKKDIISAALKVSDHGSTSGRDSLAGFYWYYNYSEKK